MAKKKVTATTKVMVYMPNPLYHQLRKAMFKMVRNNRSQFICEAIQHALEEPRFVACGLIRNSDKARLTE